MRTVARPESSGRRTPTRPDDPPDRTTAWARDVVDGRIIAGDLVCHAAERHLRDLKDGPARGLFWDPAAAEHKIGFFPSVLAITGGLKAGQPFELLPYTTFLTGSLYGWRRANGLRRFRTCWVETGKGQAKSPWMAAMGLLEMRFAGVPRSEVYAIAGTKEQANVLFRDAVAMVRAKVPENDETLEEWAELVTRGTGINTWMIEWDGSAEDLGTCFFRSVASGDTISGPKPRLVLADEVHEHPDDGPIELWLAGIQKVPGDPLMILGTNTPGADQIVGTTYSDYYSRVAMGDFADDTALAFIATTDEKKDDPLNNPASWPKSLPALGITFECQKIEEMVQQAAGLPARALTVKRLYFGIRVGTAESWIDQGCWEAVLGRVDAGALRGCPCWLGMDLSQRNDLTALAAVWRGRDGKLRAKVWYWTPADTVFDRTAEDKAPYDKWVQEAERYNSCLTATPGRSIGKDFVAVQVRDLCAVQSVDAMAFDPAHIKDFIAECGNVGFKVWQYAGPDQAAGDGLKMIVHAQGAKGLHGEAEGKCLWMPRSIERLEELVLTAGIMIDDSPVTRWCSSNMTLDTDGQGNRFPNKKRSRGRIDGIVALAMAVGAATGTAPAKRSVYERRGILFV